MGLAGNLLAGRYRLDEPIGSGGFSEVWRATDTVLARPIAVKLLHPGCAQQPEVLARFRAEAQRAATLWHVNIAHIYDYDEPADGGQPYLVMELVDGPSLAGVLAGGPLSAAWAQTAPVRARRCQSPHCPRQRTFLVAPAWTDTLATGLPPDCAANYRHGSRRTHAAPIALACRPRSFRHRHRLRPADRAVPARWAGVLLVGSR